LRKHEAIKKDEPSSPHQRPTNESKEEWDEEILELAKAHEGSSMKRVGINRVLGKYVLGATLGTGMSGK